MTWHVIPSCVYAVTLACPQHEGLAAHMQLSVQCMQSAQCIPVTSDSALMQWMVLAIIVLSRKFQVQLWH